MNNLTCGIIALVLFVTSVLMLLANKAFSRKQPNRFVTNIAVSFFLLACWVLCYAVVASTYREFEVGYVAASSKAGGEVSFDRNAHPILFWLLIIIQIIGEAAILWIVALATMKFLTRSPNRVDSIKRRR
jgi:hypothetical protein